MFFRATHYLNTPYWSNTIIIPISWIRELRYRVVNTFRKVTCSGRSKPQERICPVLPFLQGNPTQTCMKLLGGVSEVLEVEGGCRIQALRHLTARGKGPSCGSAIALQLMLPERESTQPHSSKTMGWGLHILFSKILQIRVSQNDRRPRRIPP